MKNQAIQKNTIKPSRSNHTIHVIIAKKKKNSCTEWQCKFSQIKFLNKFIQRLLLSNISVYPPFLHNQNILHARTLLFILVLHENISIEISPVVAITRARHIYKGRERLEKTILSLALKKMKTNDHTDVFQKRICTGTAWLPRILCSLCSKIRNTGNFIPLVRRNVACVVSHGNDG